MFTEKFDSYVCEGDSIACEVNGILYIARVYRDDIPDAPDERDDGFWPSLNPADPGYVGESPAIPYNIQMEHAKKVMKAWKDDEWFYCGIKISASKAGIVLDDHAASLWGIECNYPLIDGTTNNDYLTDCANDLLGEAIARAENVLEKLRA